MSRGVLPDDSTTFYDALAPLFDVMTDWEARLASEGPFLRARLEAIAAQRVLDAACGSGGHALWLARQGYTVMGVDASPAMIALAQQKAAATDLPMSFAVARLTELPGNARYDAVLCLGNSLPHLLTEEALRGALQNMAAALRPGGLLLLQNLNYDLRWRQQPRWFAAQGGELNGQPVLVWRFADYDTAAGRILFHVALFHQMAQRWEVAVHTTPQRPLFRADLEAVLNETGFERIQTFGRLALPAEPFDAERSGDLIVAAQRAR